jgi:hypothetical protein
MIIIIFIIIIILVTLVTFFIFIENILNNKLFEKYANKSKKINKPLQQSSQPIHVPKPVQQSCQPVQAHKPIQQSNQNNEQTQPQINQNIPNIQSGLYSTNKNIGNIIFDRPFTSIPKVFIQPTNTENISSSIVNVSKITPIGFSFSKNKIYEEDGGMFSMPVINPDMSNSFNWMAIG